MCRQEKIMLIRDALDEAPDDVLEELHWFLASETGG